ncbi:MAG: hypothetical protein KDB14_06830, partial [Planctomycetales bacterium]|nr:hypothetical protein [Planctomycetales bacterium]
AVAILWRNEVSSDESLAAFILAHRSDAELQQPEEVVAAMAQRVAAADAAHVLLQLFRQGEAQERLALRVAYVLQDDIRNRSGWRPLLSELERQAALEQRSDSWRAMALTVLAACSPASAAAQHLERAPIHGTSVSLLLTWIHSARTRDLEVSEKQQMEWLAEVFQADSGKLTATFWERGLGPLFGVNWDSPSDTHRRATELLIRQMADRLDRELGTAELRANFCHLVVGTQLTDELRELALSQLHRQLALLIKARDAATHAQLNEWPLIGTPVEIAKTIVLLSGELPSEIRTAKPLSFSLLEHLQTLANQFNFGGAMSQLRRAHALFPYESMQELLELERRRIAAEGPRNGHNFNELASPELWVAFIVEGLKSGARDYDARHSLFSMLGLSSRTSKRARQHRAFRKLVERWADLVPGFRELELPTSLLRESMEPAELERLFQEWLKRSGTEHQFIAVRELYLIDPEKFAGVWAPAMAQALVECRFRSPNDMKLNVGEMLASYDANFFPLGLDVLHYVDVLGEHARPVAPLWVAALKDRPLAGHLTRQHRFIGVDSRVTRLFPLAKAAEILARFPAEAAPLKPWLQSLTNRSEIPLPREQLQALLQAIEKHEANR